MTKIDNLYTWSNEDIQEIQKPNCVVLCYKDCCLQPNRKYTVPCFNSKVLKKWAYILRINVIKLILTHYCD